MQDDSTDETELMSVEVSYPVEVAVLLQDRASLLEEHQDHQLDLHDQLMELGFVTVRENPAGVRPTLRGVDVYVKLHAALNATRSVNEIK